MDQHKLYCTLYQLSWPSQNGHVESGNTNFQEKKLGGGHPVDL